MVIAVETLVPRAVRIVLVRRKEEHPTWLRVWRFVLVKGSWALAMVVVFLVCVELFDRWHG